MNTFANDFSDLESDDLDAVTGESATEIRPTFLERCTKCGGSGRFRHYSGYDMGPCYSCKGAGQFTRLTSPEARSKAKTAKLVKAAKTSDENWADFQHALPDEAAWVLRNRESFPFAQAMEDSVRKWASLTENQLGAIRRGLERDQAYAARKVEAAQAYVAKVEAAPVADVSKVEEAFAKAHTAIRSPKLRLGDFVFSPAKAASQNAGAIYVKTPGSFDDSTYLGKVMGGKFLASRDCSEDLAKQIIAAAADPAAAAVAYGRKFGSCAICGRELTVTESIERGIGPICAERFGF